MIADLLCIASLVLVFFCTRRSLGAGMVALLAVGYTYGILRANFPTNSSHFIFDAGVLGLYTAVFMHPATARARYRTTSLQVWVAVLIGWPLLMFFVPIQDWLIQLVGLRGAVFFIPFLLIGARMEEEDFHTLVTGVAILNICELGIATAQFFFGIERFFPHNAVTELIYKSNDVAGGAYRIPATFVASAAYGGVMALTVPFLVGVWTKPSLSLFHKRLLEAGLVASGLGVFLSASRTSAILLAMSVVGIFTSLRLKTSHRAGIVAVLVLIGWLVGKDSRLQRFTTLSPDVVTQRIGWSVNSTFLDVLMNYPMGNGLGGGGTSIPYFLLERLHNRVSVENEYARILLEQGVLGLMTWVGFIAWLVVTSWPGKVRDQYLGRLLLWCTVAFSFASAPVGTGLLTSIPGTAILLLAAGWLVGRRREEEAVTGQQRMALARSEALQMSTSR
jgi:hypothetical protein